MNRYSATDSHLASKTSSLVTQLHGPIRKSMQAHAFIVKEIRQTRQHLYLGQFGLIRAAIFDIRFLYTQTITATQSSSFCFHLRRCKSGAAPLKLEERHWWNNELQIDAFTLSCLSFSCQLCIWTAFVWHVGTEAVLTYVHAYSVALSAAVSSVNPHRLMRILATVKSNY